MAWKWCGHCGNDVTEGCMAAIMAQDGDAYMVTL